MPAPHRIRRGALLVAALALGAGLAGGPATAQEPIEERTLELEARPADSREALTGPFAGLNRSDYRIGVPEGARYKEILNTDAQAYGGGNAGSEGGVTAEVEPCHGWEYSVRLVLPPYATLVLEPMPSTSKVVGA